MAAAHAISERAGLGEGKIISGIAYAHSVESAILKTGIVSLDRALGGGMRAGTLSEIASPRPSSGGQTLLVHLLAAIRAERRFAALVDGSDSFDPQSLPEELLEHLLWARCGTALEAMRVADALLRDENLGMIIVDTRWNDQRQLSRVKSADWYRLQRLAERTSAYVCVFTSKAMIPSAQIRLELGESLSLELADASVREIGEAMDFEVTRLRQLDRQAFPGLVKQA